MTQPSYDQSFWEQIWSNTLREHADKVAQRPPNVHLVGEVANLNPGRVLDAGCGHGMVRRMAVGVAVGGTLFMVGHRTGYRAGPWEHQHCFPR